MKQTAVEWLYGQIENKCKCIYEVIEQAKAMEKEQIKDAWINSLSTADYHSSEEYYNQTFKSE